MAVTREAPAQPADSIRTWPQYPGRWLRGCLGRLRTEPLRLYADIHRHCGPYARVRALPGAWFYFVTHPRAVEHVLVKNARNYPKAAVLVRRFRRVVGDGLFTSDGELWLRQRRLVQPAFGRPQIAALSRPMADGAGALAEEWAQGEPGRILDVAPAMMRLTLGIAGQTLFSHDISGEADTFGRALRTVFAHLGRRLNSELLPPVWLPTRGNRQVRHAQELLERVVLEVIEARRRHGPGPGDLLDLMVAARDEDSGAGMSDQQLRDEVLTLLLAGHDTVGAALSWSWYLLGQHPEVQEHLADEARGQLGGRLPTSDDLPALPLARAVFDEALRLYPPASGLVRDALHADEIDGYRLPAGSLILLGTFITHRDPDYWDQPERFKPERFLDGAAADRRKFAYYPFGGGPRVCIGNSFALTEGPLILAALAQRFRLELVPGTVVEPDTALTLRPKNGVLMRIWKR